MRFSVRNIVNSMVVSIVFGATASANVNLSFTNGSSSSVSVNAGSTFPVQIKLTSTTTSASDMVTALDYFLESENQAATATVTGIFTIVSRNTQTDGTPFGFAYITDGALSAQSPSFRLLNPTNSNDLGGSLTNGYPTDPAVSNATVVVADYVISVAANAPVATYTLTTFDPNANQGYSDTTSGPSSNHSFSSQGSYSVTVTPAPSPEPATAGLLTIAGIASLFRRRRRAMVSL
jgi:hypothetical protein